MSQKINRGLIYDQLIPVNHTFAALMIKNEQHRKILNRQPVAFNMTGLRVFYLDWKVMSN